MKMLGLMFLLSMAMIAVAEEDKPKDFETIKGKALEEMDERIKILQDGRSCIASASDKEALKACRKKTHELMKADREENKARRKERRDAKKASAPGAAQ